MLAALEGNISIGEFLVQQGADVSAVTKLGESALSIAAGKGHLRFVKLLKSHGASAQVQPHGNTFEHWLRIASGLPTSKIDALLEAVGSKSEPPLKRG